MKRIFVLSTFILFTFIIVYYLFDFSVETKEFKRIIISVFFFLFLFFSLPIKYKILTIPVFIILLVQLTSYLVTGMYLNPLTVENLNNYNAIGNNLLLKIIFLCIVFTSLYIYCLTIKKDYSKSKKIIIVTIISFIFIATKSSYPISQFFSTIHKVYKTNIANYNYKNDGKIFLKNFQNSFYQKEKLVSHFNDNQLSIRQNANLIIIFIEGFSERVISEKITPNLYRLKERVIVFDSYYNHTAATFRGLRGQLISGYQKIGGWEENEQGLAQITKDQLRNKFEGRIESLPSILNKNGYFSLFIGPHDCKDNLFTMMKSVGFLMTKGKCDLPEHQNPIKELSDRESFDLLKKSIVEINRKNKIPFFISFYNIETHHGMNVNEVKYPFEDNEYYNKFYNFDHWLGEFVNWFDNSELANNTYLVITADHSTFSVEKFEKLFKFKSKSETHFVDRIPLIIYSKNISQQTINANGRNSLCLAPTMLDLLGLDNITTHFLGNSLFDKNISFWERISIVNNVLVNTASDDVRDLNELDSKHEEELNLFYGFAG